MYVLLGGFDARVTQDVLSSPSRSAEAAQVAVESRARVAQSSTQPHDATVAREFGIATTDWQSGSDLN